ncbi:hypothetical protein BD779DRAFT_1576261 [Infundibulicybe gibba]|nr:hypothetical protein BD779DRAFT_1576261 [Infundibulicybe gibba]
MILVGRRLTRRSSINNVREFGHPQNFDPLRCLCLILTSSYPGSTTTWASLRYNPRRLEAPFYGAWGHILSYLISDLAPDAWVVPQHTVYDPHDHKPKREESVITEEDGSAIESIPDFAIMCCSPEPGASWQPRTKVGTVEGAGFAEIKSPPSRTLRSVDDFKQQLDIKIKEAMEQVEDAAFLAFEDKDRKLTKLVLIAASGEWWRFCIMDRNHLERADTKTNTKGSEVDHEDSEVDHEGSELDHKVRSKKTARGRAMVPAAKRKQRRPSRSPGNPRSHQDLGHDHMEKCWDDITKAIPPPGTWSNNILYGSEASNQRFYLIHSTIAELQGQLKPAADASNDDAPIDGNAPGPEGDPEADADEESEDSDEMLLRSGDGNPGDL